jgi:hypothetical protein
MNGPEHFEERLERQPLRQVPPAWREDILNAARAAAPAPCPSQRASRAAFLSTLNHQLSTILWPHPKAWAGLAAVWLLIAGLNFAAREPAQPEVARQAAPPPPQLRELLHQQEQMFAELLGPVEQPEADRPKPARPQPHSQRYEPFLKA